MPCMRVLIVFACIFPYHAHPNRPRRGAELLEVESLPVSVKGRFVVDRLNQRVKWACVNWHGLEQKAGVPGGLDVKNIHDITARIRSLGFNCVRLPISVYGVLHNPMVSNSSFNSTLNPGLIGLTWLEVLDATIDALSTAQLMIILDRHMLMPGNNPSNVSLQASIWYGLGFSATDNIRALEIVAERVKHKPYVVAFDIINEPHDQPGIQLTWGDGNENSDLHLYFETAGNAVLEKNPDLLIIAEGMCHGKVLTYLKSGPQVKLKKEGRLVYSPHSYVFFSIAGIISTNAGHIPFMDNMSWPGIAWWCFFIDAVMIAPVITLNAFVYYRMGMPAIHWKLWVQALANWLALGMLFIGGIQAFLYWNNKYSTGYCGYQADHEHLPRMLSCGGGALCLWVVGVALFHPCRDRRKRRELVQHLMSDCDICSDDEHASSVPEEHSKSFELETGGSSKEENHANQQCLHFGSRAIVALMTFSASLFIAVLMLGFFAASLSSQSAFDYVSDYNFGFLLQEGQPYTAPVFIGEFGDSVHSEFLQKIISYMASRDIDWAYWPLNPVRPYGGIIGPNGYETGDKDPDEWVEDPWSFVGTDWQSIRYTWMYEEIMRIMQWPSLQTGITIPCNRWKHPQCGG